MDPLLWCAVGLALIFLEFITPGFIIAFFGISALGIALMQWLFPLPLAWQLGCWAVLSLVLLFGCRKFCARVFKGVSSVNEVDDDGKDCTGETAHVADFNETEMSGKVQFRGSLWNARFEVPRKVGDSVVIVRRENITLFVK